MEKGNMYVTQQKANEKHKNEMKYKQIKDFRHRILYLPSHMIMNTE